MLAVTNRPNSVVEISSSQIADCTFVVLLVGSVARSAGTRPGSVVDTVIVPPTAPESTQHHRGLGTLRAVAIGTLKHVNSNTLRGSCQFL